jgi:hypothetical protein
MNFIKKLFQSNSDESVHRQFIRFGKGEYGRRALLSLRKTAGSVKLKSSFEFANDFVLFVSDLEKVSFNGNIWSKEEIPGLKGDKKSGKWVYEVEGFTSNQVKETANLAYFFLLNGEGSGIKLKIKAKLPKPGKGEDKIDDKFCQMEIDEKYYGKAKEDFFWDLPDGKKMSVEHRFVINEIVLPKTSEKDYALLREMSKRKGKIIRTADVDGKEIKKELSFEA